MKGLLYLLPILALAASEAPNAPYPASGWRPSGPSFELPQKQTANQQDSFLPGREDQRFTTPASEYGAPEEDHSVQGLPVQEQTPLFMVSPINGQQYVGKDFNKDLRVLQEQLRQLEAQRQRQYSPSSQSDSDQEQEDYPKQQTPPTNTNNPGGSRFDSPRYPQKGINTQLGTTNQPQGNIATQFGKPNNPQSNFNTGFGYNRPQETDTQYDAPRNVQENPNGGFANPNSPQDNQNRQFLNPSQTQFRFNSPNPGQNPQSNGEASRNNINFRTNVNAQPSDTVTPNNDDEEVSTERTLNETNDSAQPKATGVEITQQQLTQLPNPNQLAQLALLQQYSSVPFTQQIGQIQAPIFYQPLPQAVSQNLIASPYLGQLRSGFDPTNPANLAAIQATLAQRQLTLAQTQGLEPSQMAQLMQNQRQLEQAQLRQSQLAAQNQAQFIPTQQQYAQPQYVQQPQLVQNQGFLHPQNQYSNPQGFVQPELLQSQPGFLQPQQSQGGFIQQQQQPQFDQAQSGFVQMQSPYPQIQPQSQMQYPQDQSGFLQSGFNVNQQGNGLGSSKAEEGDIDEEEETDEDFGNSATAVSTSFGKRLPTTPRPAQSGFTRYGTPSAPTQQYGTPQGRGSFAAQAPATTDDSLDENPTTEDVPAVAVANAVADGRRGKPNKLRNRRIRPLFTLDKNGQLVQLQK